MQIRSLKRNESPRLSRRRQLSLDPRATMALVIPLARLAAIILGLLAFSKGQSYPDMFQRTLGHLVSQTAAEVQAEAAKDVAIRLLGEELASNFVLSVDSTFGIPGKDSFQLTKDSRARIEIIGNSGVAATWGLHYYLKHYCNVHVSWEGSQIALPEVLPPVNITIKANDRFRYYQNVCTAGYSTVWWQWPQWERHIDWMALNGINLALALNGQEAIWQMVYLKLKLTQEEINEHFGGPAFLPWTRMGNIRGFGGPLSEAWHNQTVVLQRGILRRMRELGMIPVLPAFAGHVPRAFSRLYPDANMTKTGCWNKFEDEYCCPLLLEPTDPLFQVVGKMFLETYIEQFGTDHVYTCDTFNENEPHSSELSYLRNVSNATFSAMSAVDPQAVWIMQGWLFVHDFEFWTLPRVEAFLTSVPLGRMIVLDLQSEQFPQYRRLNSYYGQPFIWCMLHNFGGTLGMFGSARIINERVFEGRDFVGSTMIGTGLTPEGINQNYVIYDLMNEMAYRLAPVDLGDWFERYSDRRYGRNTIYAKHAWVYFGRTIYNFHGTERIRGKYVITRRPSLKLSTWKWYKPEVFYSIFTTFLEGRHELENSTLYRHDVVDTTRQFLQLTADDIYVKLMKCYNRNNLTCTSSYADDMLELFGDLERILASGEDFLLGRWLEDAKTAASDCEDARLFEYNARNQITLWGSNGEIRDYAIKQWSGVVDDYLHPRWHLFLEALKDSLINSKSLNLTLINERMFLEVEKPFTLSTIKYPTEASGDSIEIAMDILKKWDAWRKNGKQV
ncbi:hypothetical protein KM043_003513 [Ampulex compressa]|nr:hypothetical protein KM043_003513 [Ampulex compressa]